jgi:quinol monooxygenase YgiN
MVRMSTLGVLTGLTNTTTARDATDFTPAVRVSWAPLRHEMVQPMEILIVGSIAVDREHREALLAAIRPLVQRTREDEPGCLDYAFTADTVEDDRVVVVERWQDEATLAAHFVHPNFLATKTTLHDFGSGISAIRKYRIDLSEPVRDSENRYRADFFTITEDSS